MCIRDSSNVVIVDMSDRNSNIMLFPNPVSEELFFSTTYDVDVYIYNTLGQKINSRLLSGERSFDISNLESGEYVLKFSNGIIKQILKSKIFRLTYYHYLILAIIIPQLKEGQNTVCSTSKYFPLLL